MTDRGPKRMTADEYIKSSGLHPCRETRRALHFTLMAVDALVSRGWPTADAEIAIRRFLAGTQAAPELPREEMLNLRAGEKRG